MPTFIRGGDIGLSLKRPQKRYFKCECGGPAYSDKFYEAHLKSPKHVECVLREQKNNKK